MTQHLNPATSTVGQIREAQEAAVGQEGKGEPTAQEQQEAFEKQQAKHAETKRVEQEKIKQRQAELVSKQQRVQSAVEKASTEKAATASPAIAANEDSQGNLVSDCTASLYEAMQDAGVKVPQGALNLSLREFITEIAAKNCIRFSFKK